MIGVWCLVAWMKLGRPPALRLVELGPGRGTLMADLLRGTAAFPEFARAVSVDLVEISPALRRVQWGALKCSPVDGGDGAVGVGSGSGSGSSEASNSINEGGGSRSSSSGSSSTSSGSSSTSSSGSAIRSGTDQQQAFEGVSGVGGASARVKWHASLEEVPLEGPPVIYIAHEFFDALPVHQFVKGGRCAAPAGCMGPAVAWWGLHVHAGAWMQVVLLHAELQACTPMRTPGQPQHASLSYTKRLAREDGGHRAGDGARPPPPPIRPVPQAHARRRAAAAASAGAAAKGATGQVGGSGGAHGGAASFCRCLCRLLGLFTL